MINETLRKFNYPDTLIWEYDRWVVMLRPAQITIGSLVLASKEDAERFSDLSTRGFAELKQAVGDVEATLAKLFDYDRINYLMLMMVDRQVHYHIVPRYAAPVLAGGREYADPCWPGPPDVTRALEIPEEEFHALRERIATAWPS